MSADSQALINKQQVDVNSWRGAWASTKRWREQIKCNLSQHSPQAKRNVSSHNKPQISSSTRGIYVKVYEAYECTYVYVCGCVQTYVCMYWIRIGIPVLLSRRLFNSGRGGCCRRSGWTTRSSTDRLACIRQGIYAHTHLLI